MFTGLEMILHTNTQYSLFEVKEQHKALLVLLLFFMFSSLAMIFDTNTQYSLLEVKVRTQSIVVSVVVVLYVLEPGDDI
jgi:glucan phosphoethanolaminetransferase (alkaline phosphatase superfamily)